MNNFDQMRVKQFLESIIRTHGATNSAGQESFNDYVLRIASRSGALAGYAEEALDLLGTITFPDEVEHETA